MLTGTATVVFGATVKAPAATVTAGDVRGVPVYPAQRPVMVTIREGARSLVVAIAPVRAEAQPV